MIHRAVLTPGNGIGPEVSAATLSVLKAAGAPPEFEECLAGEAAREVGERISTAYRRALADGDKTRDLGGTLGTREFAQAVAGRL